MRYLTAMEAARQIGVNEKTVRLWIKHGTYGLTAHHPNGAPNRLAIAESDVERIKRERSQYTGTPGKAESTQDNPDITVLQARIDELERKYTELEQRLRNERRIEPPYIASTYTDTSTSHTPVKRPYNRTEPKQQHDFPPGYIGMYDFAVMCGVAASTLKRHIHTGWKDAAGNFDKIEAESRPRPGHPDQTQYYLSPEQQRAAFAFWDRHNVHYQKPEQGDQVANEAEEIV